MITILIYKSSSCIINPLIIRTALIMITAFAGILMVGCSLENNLDRIAHDYQNCSREHCNTILVSSKAPILKTQLNHCYKCLKSSQSRLEKCLKSDLTIQQQREVQSLLTQINQQKLLAVNFRRDPSQYNLGKNIEEVLKRVDEPITYRLDEINLLLKTAKEYYEAAKENIKKPLPGKCQLAVERQLSTMAILNLGLKDSIQKAPLKRVYRDSLTKNIQLAKLSVKDYLAYCESLWFTHQDSTLR